MRPHVGLMERGINMIGPKRLEKMVAMGKVMPRLPGSVPGFARWLGSY